MGQTLEELRGELRYWLDNKLALALDGGNFSGRTDLLRWLAGLETIEGVESDDTGQNSDPSVYVGPEVYNSISGLGTTAREELRLHVGSAPEASPLAQLIKEIGLEALYDRNPFTLSGGEQALLALTSALALKPRLLAVDCALEQIDSTYKTLLLRRMLNGLGDHTLIAIADNCLHEIEGVEDLEKVAVACTSGSKTRPFEVDQVSADVDLPLEPESSCHLSLGDIDFRYPRSAAVLHNVSAQLEPGKVYFLEGRNGAGKSTLAKILCGVLRPDSGRIVANQEEVHPWKHPGQLVAYHFQNPDVQLFSTTVEGEVYASLGARDHVLDKAWGQLRHFFGAKADKSRLAATERKERAEAVLEAFGLSRVRKEHPLDMPFVLRKRVALAATVAMGRPWLILDEPTLGQDAVTSEKIAHIITKLLELGTGIIVISHSLRFRRLLHAEPLKLARGMLYQ